MTGRKTLDADEIRVAVGIEEFARILEELGATVNRRKGRSTCPAHGGDNLEALHYNEKDGVILWTCFTGCGGKGGDVLELVRKARETDFPSAVEWLGDFLGITPETPRTPRRTAPAAPPPPPPDMTAARAKRLSRLWETFATSDEKGETYLLSRGITPDPSRVRFNLGKTGDLEVDELAAKGYRIAVPLYAPDGRLASFQFRLAEDPARRERWSDPPPVDPRLRYSNLKGSIDRGVFGLSGGLASLGEKDLLLVVEGLTDSLVVASAGELEYGGRAVRFVGFPGVGGSKHLLETFGEESLRGRSVILALDQDVYGEKAAQERAGELLRVGAKPFRLRTAEKDLCAEIHASAEKQSDADETSPARAVLLRTIGAAMVGTWDPDARDAPSEWRSSLEEWRKTFTRTGITTGLPSVDDLLGGGWRERRLYVLGGLTGSGKSAFALRAAHAAALAGTPVLIVQYEVEEIETRARLVAPLTTPPCLFYGKLLASDLLTPRQREDVSSAWERYAAGVGSRIFVSVPTPASRLPKPGSIEWVKAEADRIKLSFGSPPLVIVDYLQPAAALSEDFEKDGNLRLATGKVSLGLRDLSRSLSCPVLVLSSVPRAAYLRKGGKDGGYRLPELGDLKEAGEIEFNADAVLYLWPTREDWEAHEGEDQERDNVAPRPMLFLAAKGRQTGKGSALLTWNPPLGTFTDEGKQPKREPKPKAKKGERPKALDVEGLGNLIIGNGKLEVGGLYGIKEARLVDIAKAEHGTSSVALKGLVAKHSERFERIKHSDDEAWWILYSPRGDS